jgi:cyclophilin family peptidyl-prolyl cis-trans isomerase
MARQSGLTNSATSQWFFNLTNNAFLDAVDGGFTVFGRVVRGTNVLNRFNEGSAKSGIYILPLQAPLNELPVLTNKPTTRDLVYTDISLLSARISRTTRGQPQISWESVSNKVNQVEFTTQLPPVWIALVSTNGTGKLLSVVDSTPSEAARLYRIRVDY